MIARLDREEREGNVFQISGELVMGRGGNVQE